MPREEVSFARGTKSTMPTDKVPGRLLIATDTGEAYVDDTTASRVQLKDTTKVSKSGDTMSGPLNMRSNKITNVANPTEDTDAANLRSVKSQVDAAIRNAQYTGKSPISVNNINHTISHSNIGSAGSVGPTANSTASHGGGITIPCITVDAQGHVSAKTNRTITLPAGPTNMRGASTSAAGAAGYAPAPSAGAANRYLRSDGTWAVPPDTNTTYSAFKGATSSAAGGSGLVPAPSTGYQNRYLAGDGTWKVIPDNNTTYSAGTGLKLSGTTFSLATSGVAAGSYGPTANVSGTNGTTINIPQITVDAYGRVTSVSNRVLTNRDTNTTYAAMKGATGSAAGSAGLVPAPAAGYNTRFLRGDGTWVVPTNTTYTAGRGLSLSGTQIGHSSSITAGNRGPTANATVSPGSTFSVPQIYYDAYGHVTSSATNRTMTLNSSILDTSDILKSLSGVTSNEKVLGAKLVADAIININSQISTLNSKLPKAASYTSGPYNIKEDGATWQGTGFPTKIFDTIGLVYIADDSTYHHAYRVPKSGIYKIDIYMDFSTANTPAVGTTMYGRLVKNKTVELARESFEINKFQGVSYDFLVQLSANDLVSFELSHETSGVNYLATGNNNRFNIIEL